MSMFKKNISALSVLSSYHIWLCRSDPTFQEPSFLPPPFLLLSASFPSRSSAAPFTPAASAASPFADADRLYSYAPM